MTTSQPAHLENNGTVDEGLEASRLGIVRVVPWVLRTQLHRAGVLKAWSESWHSQDVPRNPNCGMTPTLANPTLAGTLLTVLAWQLDQAGPFFIIPAFNRVPCPKHTLFSQASTLSTEPQSETLSKISAPLVAPGRGTRWLMAARRSPSEGGSESIWRGGEEGCCRVMCVGACVWERRERGSEKG